MLLTCPHCGFSRDVPDEQVPERPVRALCPGCQQTFAFDRNGAEALVPPAAQPDSTPAAGPTAEALPKAGFWLRLVALLLDTVIVWTLRLVVLIPLAIVGGFASVALDDGPSLTLWLLILCSHLIGYTYDVFFTGYHGQTPGKMILRLRVVRCDGGAVGYGRAFLREVPGKFLSALIFYIGYAMAGFDSRKQALHDRLAGTYVLKL